MSACRPSVRNVGRPPRKSALTLAPSVATFRPPAGSLDRWPFVSQGSGRAECDAIDAPRFSSRVRGFSPTAGARRQPYAAKALKPSMVSCSRGRDRRAGVIPGGCRTDKKKKKESRPPTVQETVGDLAFVVSRGEWKVEGVGLVRGLDNTGADPPQSWYRKQLVDEMTKAGVEHAEKLLAKPQWSMVIVRSQFRLVSTRRTGWTCKSRSRRPAARPVLPAAT